MTTLTEREKMLAALPYRAADPELVALRQTARRLCRAFNDTEGPDRSPRAAILAELFGSIGPGAEVEPPLRVDYGCHVHAGKDIYINFGCVILDICEVRIGDEVMFAPNVQIYAATHPIDAADRMSGLEMGAPVTIGNRVWVGGGSILLPGVSVGADTVIGAGSVVTRDLPAGVVAAGNPCRVLRAVGESDRLPR